MSKSTVECYFTADDPGEDRRLILRTLAVLRDISEIDGETTTGEAFRKYWRQYQSQVTTTLKPILEANIANSNGADVDTEIKSASSIQFKGDVHHG